MSKALAEGADKFGMRICEFSVQGNHVHLLAEAADARALSHGMQGFSIRLARGLNRMMSRAGKVLADRFHARILRTPTEVVRALRYVRANRQIHRERWSTLGTRNGSPSAGADIARGVIGRGDRARFRPPLCGPSIDPYSSAVAEHRELVANPRTYLLSRAQAVGR